MRAELSNPNHPELGVAAIHLPISEWEYDHVMQELEALNIGDAVARDCRLGELASGLESLKVLECQNINIDELDYLAKRLDSLDEYEAKQFEAAAARFELTDMTDLINLTFCSQQVTVISDFSCLEEVGRDHYLSINGGCAGTGELDNLDGYETALLLIGSGTGVVTP